MKDIIVPIWSYVKDTALAFIAIFVPIRQMQMAILVLAGADLILALIAAKKRGVPITSSGLKRTLVKVALYESAVWMSFLAETFLLEGSIPITKIVAGFIGVIELKSGFENIDLINGESLFTSIAKKILETESTKLTLPKE